MKILLFNVFLLLCSSLFAQQRPKVEPPFWWTGMAVQELQLLVHAKGIASTSPVMTYQEVMLKGVVKTGNPDYLFLDLLIGDSALPGSFVIDFLRDEDVQYSYEYQLYPRAEGSADRQGFGPEDVMMLIMPDRFANGNPMNDDLPGMLEKANRYNPDGRHGGDLKGIADNLDYISNMGFTAIWLNPVLENNNPRYSYHGYAISDFYRLDPRIGTNGEYVQFVDRCHDMGIKVIKDMVFNHCSHMHWWMENLPADDWIHQWPEFTRTNYRAPVNSDPHASQYDKTLMLNGWFDTSMPDMNQQNGLLANYLIQNSIWWVEYAGLDGIRMDTYPYSDQAFMARWMQRILLEYPGFNVVGEAWLQKEAITAWYAASATERFGYNSHLTNVPDFPLRNALAAAFNEQETWTEGMPRLYYVLAQDFLYDDPYSHLIFADNHDMSRYFTVLGGDFDKFRMGMAFLYTTRGIPSVYYGTEILMEGEEHRGHGYIREDFPGGWAGDKINAFTGEGLQSRQVQAREYIRLLQNWRKEKQAIHQGKLIHFLPESGIYVYFRIYEEERVMVVLNNNMAGVKMPPLERFDECLSGNRKAFEVTTQSACNDLQQFVLPPRSAMIFEISHEK
jgi:neopullulanase